MNNLRFQKPWHSYVPWTAMSCFVLVTIGMILWAVGTQTAFTNTNSLLHLLQISVDSTLATVHGAGIAAVVVCLIFALLMVCMALGRTSLERKVDEQGKVVCGTWLWLAVLALLAAVWWLIVFWMVFVIFGSCLWYAAAFTVEGALSSILDVLAATPSTNSSLTGNSTACPSTCFNLAYFSHFISYVQDACICSQSSIQTAYNAADAAANALHLTIAGSFIMWTGSSFLLMVAVGAFAKTRRERELLIRIQRNAEENASQLAGVRPAAGEVRMSENPMYYKDTQPLLAVVPHSGGSTRGPVMMAAPGQVVAPPSRIS